MRFLGLGFRAVQDDERSGRGWGLRVRVQDVGLKGSGSGFSVYRGTSLTRKCTPLGPYSGTMPRALRWPYGVGGFS